MLMHTRALLPWSLNKRNIKRKDKNTPNFSPTSVKMSQPPLIDAKVGEPQSLPRKTKLSLKYSQESQEESLIIVVKATSRAKRKPIMLVDRLRH